MEILFLGTACMFPTKERNHSSVFVRYKNEGILVDCGEGTQRQLRIADIKPSKITKILISHWDGDHVLGLPGLLQSMNASEYDGKLKIYGQKGIKNRIKKVLDAFPFDNRLDLEVIEIKKNPFFENKDFKLESFKLEHFPASLGFNLIEKDKRKILLSKVKKLGIPEGPLLGKLQENKSIKWKGKVISPKEVTCLVKGKKISFVSDTVLCNNIYKNVKNADILVTDATYTSLHEDLAKKYKHMTSKQAAQVASKCNVSKLVLTHFSQRYKDISEVLNEAKDIFPNTIVAHDFMKIKI